MVTRRRRNKTPLLPVHDLSYCTDSMPVPFWCGVLRCPQHHQSAVCFLLLRLCSLLSCKLPFFCLSSLQLSALILRRSPANRILFALRQDKHCPCVTPKTFHRLSHFQHGSDIAIIGFFLQRKCSEDTMRLERKKKKTVQ